MLADSLLGVELDAEGKVLIGALNGLDNVNTIGGSNTRDPQWRATNVTYHLVVPRGHIADDIAATDGIKQ